MVGFPQTFAETSLGSRINVVGRLQCWDPEYEVHLFRAIHDGMSFLVEGIVRSANEW